MKIEANSQGRSWAVKSEIMPTPDETTTSVARTPPIQQSSSRASFASCPPEEEREPHPPREARSQSAQQDSRPAESREDGHTTRQDIRTERDAQAGASQIESPREEREKGEHIEDAATGSVTEAPSPVGSPEGSSDSDVRLAQSMATTALGGSTESNETAPRYLCYPPLNRNRVCVSE